MTPAVELQSPNHWTVREVPGCVTVDGTCLKTSEAAHENVSFGRALEPRILCLLYFPLFRSSVSNDLQEGVGCSFIIAISVCPAFVL